jgi:hypothetical protein
LTFALTLQRVLGPTFQFSKALSGTFRISPGSVLGKQHKEPTRPSPTHRWIFFAKYRALLAHGNILGSAKDWILEKEIFRQSDVPIILRSGGTPTLHIVDEHVISFTPTNTKFQKNALSHIK